MKHMNKTLRRNCLSLALCLMLFASLLAAPAFAAGTLVIIGGPVENNTVVEPSSSAVVISGSGNSVSSGIVSDTPAAQVIVGSKIASGTQAEPAQAYVVQDGNVVAVGQQQAVQSSAAAEAAALPVAAPAAAEPTGIAAELLAKVNAARAENGVGVVKYSAALQSIADTRVKESVVSFGHTRPDGSHCSTAVTVDYQITGENLIQGPSEHLTADLMMETWMNSETHRYNILLSEFTDMAVGTYTENGVTYVSMIFIG